MNQANVVTAVSTLLSDTLSQVSSDMLNLAVDEAWNDAWVATPVWDTSIVFSMSVYQYTLPATVTVVDAIYLQRASGIFPEEISSSLWEVVNGVIIFQKSASFTIPDGYTLQIRGKYKLAQTDSIPLTNYAMQNYVINYAAWVILKQLTFKKLVAFLNNDTSVSELLTFRNTIEKDVQRYRAQLQQSYVNG
jgi:hypothetical protein